MKITEKLWEIESSHGVDILLAVESGSRAWGFESQDSDYDVRFVYIRPIAWYLSILDRRDVIEPKCEFPLDFNGWDLKKALYQIYKGNPAFFEWLHSPTHYIISDETEELRKLANKYFNPRTAIYHYLHMAQGNYRTYLRGDIVKWKKYLYVIRPLLACMWIESHHSMPPVLFDEILKGHSDIPLVFIEELLEKKKGGKEADSGPKVERLNFWIEERLKHFEDKARLIQRTEKMPDDLNEYFLEMVK